MKICRNEVTDYLSINITEDEVEWDALELYNRGDEVRDGHYIYKYAGDDESNTTTRPSVEYDENIEIYPLWVNISPTNYYAMLDARTDSQTTLDENIVMTFTLENQNTFSLLNIQSQYVNISIYDNDVGAVTYTKDISTQDEGNVIDFYSYCFSGFEFASSIYVDDFPLTQSGVLTVTVVGDAPKVGRLVLGKSYYVGDTQFGGSLGIESYSIRAIDAFGNVTLKQRGSVNIDSFTVQVPTTKVPELRRKAKELDAIPILFIADESDDSIVENLLNFGYWTNFSMVLPNPVKSTLSLAYKGLL